MIRVFYLYYGSYVQQIKKEYRTHLPSSRNCESLAFNAAIAFLKEPKIGGNNRIVSRATFHVYFIFFTSTNDRFSPGTLLLNNSPCSEKTMRSIDILPRWAVLLTWKTLLRVYTNSNSANENDFWAARELANSSTLKEERIAFWMLSQHFEDHGNGIRGCVMSCKN